MQTEVTFYGRQNAELSCISPKLPRGAQARKTHVLNSDLYSNREGVVAVGTETNIDSSGPIKGRYRDRAMAVLQGRCLQTPQANMLEVGGGRKKRFGGCGGIPGILAPLSLPTASLARRVGTTLAF